MGRLHRRLLPDGSGTIVAVEGADGLAVVESSGRLDSDEAADVTLTVSTYGRDDDELARIRERWLERWSSVASG